MISASNSLVLWTLKPFCEGTHEMISLNPWASASPNMRWSFDGKKIAAVDVDVAIDVDVDVDVVAVAVAVAVEVDFVIADAMV